LAVFERRSLDASFICQYEAELCQANTLDAKTSIQNIRAEPVSKERLGMQFIV
jgi:hypothetical protein